MSRFSKLASEARQIARISGSQKTMADRSQKLERLTEHLKENNFQINSLSQLKMKHIKSFIADRLEQGISIGTLQNDMAAIRHTLRAMGKAEMADHSQLSNQSLGISGRSRTGNKIAISNEKFDKTTSLADQKDQGFSACLGLQRHLGLRAEEAIQASQSLATWAAKVEHAGQNPVSIQVIFGTKGGRVRHVVVKTDQARSAIRSAAKIASERPQSRLIDKPDLKSAYQYYSNMCRAVGLKGVNSSHSLRYAYAQECLRHYREQGFSEKEARALTSIELGHGDGRGRYVASVYG